MPNRRGLLVAALAGGLLLVAPLPTLSPAGQAALATTAVAGVLWVTGALPLAVTAVLVPPVLVVTGAVPETGDAVTGFADPVLFLMLAGFVLARALQVHGVDRRFALRLLTTLGHGPKLLVLGLMLASATLSMLVSNTATAAMLAPVAVGLADQVTDRDPEDPPANVEVAMLLGVAYAASIGGVGSLVGTPPNAIVAGQLSSLLGAEVTFVEWFAIGLPAVVVTLPIAWLLLVTVTYPPRVDVAPAREHARRELDALPALDARGRRTVAIFALTVVLWVVGGLGFALSNALPADLAAFLFGGPDRDGALYFSVVGLFAVVALVATDAADWDDLLDIDWGTLLLIGGGISLANGLATTDAMRWLTATVLDPLTGLPLLALVLVVVLASILSGEVASNTAMAAILAPLFIGFGTTIGDATTGGFLAIAAAVASSFGFALPVATPPNAIAYGTGRVGRREMLRAGGVLDVVLGVLVAGVLYALLRLGVIEAVL